MKERLEKIQKLLKEKYGITGLPAGIFTEVEDLSEVTEESIDAFHSEYEKVVEQKIKPTIEAAAKTDAENRAKITYGIGVKTLVNKTFDLGLSDTQRKSMTQEEIFAEVTKKFEAQAGGEDNNQAKIIQDLQKKLSDNSVEMETLKTETASYEAKYKEAEAKGKLKSDTKYEIISEISKVPNLSVSPLFIYNNYIQDINSKGNPTLKDGKLVLMDLEDPEKQVTHSNNKLFDFKENITDYVQTNGLTTENKIDPNPITIPAGGNSSVSNAKPVVH